MACRRSRRVAAAVPATETATASLLCSLMLCVLLAPYCAAEAAVRHSGNADVYGSTATPAVHAFATASTQAFAASELDALSSSVDERAVDDGWLEERANTGTTHLTSVCAGCESSKGSDGSCVQNHTTTSVYTTCDTKLKRGVTSSGGTGDDCIHGSTTVVTMFYHHYACVCYPGYGGQLCDIVEDACLADEGACLAGGCVSTGGGNFMCDDPCNITPCAHGGTCERKEEDGPNGYVCDCPFGYTGDNCQVDIDWCSVPPIPNDTVRSISSDEMTSGATAFTYDGAAERGITTGGPFVPCLNDGVCVDGVEGYTCNCTENFTGVVCGQEVNLCEELPDPCGENGRCVDQTYGFHCECDEYYQGVNCEIEHDCMDPEANTCDNGDCVPNQSTPSSTLDGDWVIYENGFTCDCDNGWDGQFCDLDVQECTLFAPCENGATCTESPPGNYTCSCQPGFTGHDCERNIDDCVVNGGNDACAPHGNCVDKVAGYDCACDLYWLGEICGTEHVCSSDGTSLCENGACMMGLANETFSMLESDFDVYHCICASGWTGYNCDTDINDCEPDPCAHGECTDMGTNAFECACDLGWEGTLCSVDSDDCAADPCFNQGQCTDLGTLLYECTCPNVYADGANCETLQCYPGEGIDDPVDLSRAVCETCAAGSFSDTGLACTLCEEETYQDKTGATECIDCPPEGATCKTGATKPKIQAGYFDEDPDDGKYIFLECPLPDVCLGELGCVEGHTGYMCASCEEGKYMLNDSCTDCPSYNTAFLVIGIILFCLFIGFVYYTTSSYGGSAQVFTSVPSIGLHFIQVTSIFASIDIDWPPALAKLFNIFQYFTLDIDAAAPECMDDRITFQIKWIISLLIPFFLVAMYCVVGFIAGTVLMFKPELPYTHQTLINGTIKATLLTLSIMYMALTRSALKLFDCTTQYGENGKTFLTLDAYPEIQCYNSSEYWELFPVAICALIFYCAGIPLLFYKLLDREKFVDLEYQRRCGHLFMPYKRETYWWEVTLFARKFFLVACTVLWTSKFFLQIGSIVFVMVVALLCHMWFWPYMYRYLNVTDFVLLNIIILMSSVVIWFAIFDVPIPTWLGLLLAVFLVLSVAFVLGMIALEAYTLYVSKNSKQFEHTRFWFLAWLLYGVEKARMRRERGSTGAGGASFASSKAVDDDDDDLDDADVFWSIRSTSKANRAAVSRLDSSVEMDDMARDGSFVSDIGDGDEGGGAARRANTKLRIPDVAPLSFAAAASDDDGDVNDNRGDDVDGNGGNNEDDAPAPMAGENMSNVSFVGASTDPPAGDGAVLDAADVAAEQFSNVSFASAAATGDNITAFSDTKTGEIGFETEEKLDFGD